MKKNVGLPNFFIQYLVLGGVLHGGLEASWHAEGQIIIASVDSVHFPFFAFSALWTISGPIFQQKDIHGWGQL